MIFFKLTSMDFRYKYWILWCWMDNAVVFGTKWIWCAYWV